MCAASMGCATPVCPPLSPFPGYPFEGCRRQRFVYVSVVDGTADLVGVAKMDLSRPPILLPQPLPPTSAAVAQASVELGGCAVGFFGHGPMRFGSEAVFVPRRGGGSLADEDDGCLLTMVFDGLKK